LVNPAVFDGSSEIKVAHHLCAIFPACCYLRNLPKKSAKICDSAHADWHLGRRLFRTTSEPGAPPLSELAGAIEQQVEVLVVTGDIFRYRLALQ
jgi:hypothetical protein